ncbi:glycosyltransferase family 4 protein [Pseudopedobacter beijingensis]|uniref:Glycosyltransferase family 4 protein n=1 Tax=Pseudopedobacter beijingensis TaxID=1207056 RepID=A0ABW4IAH3_9SPHI
MKVFIDDIIYSLQRTGGISTYWREVSSRLKESLNVAVLSAGQSPFWKSSVGRKLALVLPIRNRLPSYSLFHSSYLRFSSRKDICNIVTIHDLAGEEGHITGLKAYFKKQVQARCIRNADGIVCVSNYTKNMLLKFYRYPEKNIKVIYHGCSELFRPQEKQEKSNKILFIGKRDYYKNFNACIDVLERLPDYQLLIVGGGELTANEYGILNSKIEGRFTHYQYVEEEELNRIYNSCFCLIYPSTYEGFGMPLIEAMKAGCPVIAVDIPVINEVSGGNVLLVKDANNTDEYLKQVNYLTNQELRTNIIKRGLEYAKNFSWNLHVESLIDFYKETYKRKFTPPTP